VGGPARANALLLLGACWAAATPSARAEPPAPPVAQDAGSQLLLLGEVRTLTLQRSPELLGAAAEVEEARARLAARQTWENPELRARSLRWGDGRPWGERAADEVADPFATGAELALRWAPPQPWARARAEEAAEQTVAARTLDLQRWRERLVVRAEAAYLELIAATRLAEIDAEELAQRSESEETLRRQVAGGAATVPELNLATLELWAARSAQVTRRRRREAAWLELALLAGLDPEQPRALDPAPLAAPCVAPAALEAGSALPDARAHRADLQAAAARLAAARATLASRSADKLPWPGFVELAYRIGSERALDRLEFALSLELPVFHWRGAAEVEQRAIALQRQAELQREGDQVTRQVRGALQRLRSASEELALLQGAAPAAEAGVQGLRQALAEAQAAPLQAIVLQRRALQLRTQAVEAALRCHLARLELELALGQVPVASGPPASPPEPGRLP